MTIKTHNHWKLNLQTYNKRHYSSKLFYFQNYASEWINKDLEKVLWTKYLAINRVLFCKSFTTASNIVKGSGTLEKQIFENRFFRVINWIANPTYQIFLIRQIWNHSFRFIKLIWAYLPHLEPISLDDLVDIKHI